MAALKSPNAMGLRSYAAGLISGVLLFLVPVTCISAGVVSEIRSVGEFHSVDFRGNGALYITQDKDSQLRLEGEKELLGHYESVTKNGVLVIKLDTRSKKWRRKSIDAYISMSEVRSLKAGGSAKIIGQSPISSETLTLKASGAVDADLEVEATELHSEISGSGSVKLRGTAKSHRFVASGSADLTSYGLTTDSTKINISGAGKCEVSVSNRLDVQISGSGSVFYRGNPKTVNQKISGAGKISRVE